jgi:chromate transporter
VSYGHVEIPVSRSRPDHPGTFFVLLAGFPAAALADWIRGSRSVRRESFVAPGWLIDDAFLAGYGAAQAVPGPLFTFAAYLGRVVSPEPHGLAGAALSLVGIFLPGMLVLLGALPFWDSLRRHAGAQATMRGVNAAVVGVLGAASYAPVWTTTVHSPRDFGMPFRLRQARPSARRRSVVAPRGTSITAHSANGPPNNCAARPAFCASALTTYTVQHTPAGYTS